MLEVLGVPADALADGPLRNATTSRTKTLVPLADVATLDALTPRLDEVRGLCDRLGSTGLYPYAASGERRVDARQFPRSSGYPEDPATGLEAAALAFGLPAQGHSFRVGLVAGIFAAAGQTCIAGSPTYLPDNPLLREVVWLTTYRALAYNSPFGGFKDSGTGRNNGIEAVGQFLQTKSVWCELGTEPLDPFVIRVRRTAHHRRGKCWPSASPACNAGTGTRRGATGLAVPTPARVRHPWHRLVRLNRSTRRRTTRHDRNDTDDRHRRADRRRTAARLDLRVGQAGGIGPA